MDKPTQPVIGLEIWPLIDYVDDHLDQPFNDAIAGNLTPEGAVKLLPHMEHMVELIDRALTERDTSGYPRQQFIQMKSSLITMISSVKGSV